MKIAVAMSGGIDSTITAILLREMGHEIIGITANFKTGIPADKNNPFFSEKSIEDSRAIAKQFDFPHFVKEISDDFYHLIIDPFCREYMNGRTPNPCTHCNPLIKFKNLLEYALTLGCEKIATGHYSQIKMSEEGRYFISRGKDPVKDQSYFLYRLSQYTLSHVLFPLGDFLKSEVRDMALKRNLSIAHGLESQEICFIPDNNYSGFIGKMMGTEPPPGNIVDREGNILGKHKGIHNYTIGQRRGLGIAAPHPLYVVRINAADNTITAGFSEELETTGLVATDMNYMKATSLDDIDVLVKTRSTQQPVPAHLTQSENFVKVAFGEKQKGISPGQAAVFYNNDGDVLGGGIIEKSLNYN